MIDRYNPNFTPPSPSDNKPELWAARITLSGVDGLTPDSEIHLADYFTGPSEPHAHRAGVIVSPGTGFIVASIVQRTFEVHGDNHRPREAFEDIAGLVLAGVTNLSNVGIASMELEQTRVAKYHKIGDAINGDINSAMNTVTTSAVDPDQARAIFATLQDTFRVLQRSDASASVQ